MSGNDERMYSIRRCSCQQADIVTSYWILFNANNKCIGWCLHDDYVVRYHEAANVKISQYHRLSQDAKASIDSVVSIQCPACNSYFTSGPVYETIIAYCKYRVNIGVYTI